MLSAIGYIIVHNVAVKVCTWTTHAMRIFNVDVSMRYSNGDFPAANQYIHSRNWYHRSCRLANTKKEKLLPNAHVGLWSPLIFPEIGLFIS